MIRSFFKDSFIYTLPMILTYGTNFFLLPLYTSVLTPTDYGAMEMLKTFESIALLIVCFEISQAFAVYYSSEKDVEVRIKYASTALWFTCFCYLVFLIICLIYSAEVSSVLFGSSGYIEEFKLGILYIVISGLFHIVTMQLRFDLKSIKYAISSLIAFFITAICSVVFAYIYHAGFIGMIGGLLIGSFAGLMYALLQSRNCFKLEIDFKILKNMLIFSIPLIPASATVFINGYVDRIFINHYLSLEEVGLYGIGFKIAAIVSLMLIGFNRALTPLIFRNHSVKETPAKINFLLKIFFSISLLFFLGLSIFSLDILKILTNSSYYPAHRIVIILVPAILLSQMYMFAPGLSLSKKTRILMWIAILSAVINAFLNMVLIPIFGYIGAAWATLLAQGIAFALQFKFSQKYYFIPVRWGEMIAPLALVICMANIGLYANKFDEYFISVLIFKIFLISLLPLILIATGLFKMQEVKDWLNEGFFIMKRIRGTS